MSDDPTRPLRPADPGTPPAGPGGPAGPAGPIPGDPGGPPREAVRETVVEDGDAGWMARLEDRLSSLRTAVALVGVLAAIALGLALVELLSDDDEAGGDRGASPARVDGIEDRLDKVDERLENRVTSGDLSDLRSNQRDLAERLEAVEQAAEEQADDDPSAEIDELRQSVEGLEQQVAELEQRVEDVEEQQAQQEQQP